MNTLTQEATKKSADTKLPMITEVKSRGHLDFIDGLRGLAIAQVLIFHIWEFSHSPAAYWWNPVSWGYTGVTLFLLLSGFCLYWPMVKPVNPSPEPSLAEFARRRAHRIYPPYLIVLMVCTIADLACNSLGFKWPDAPSGGAKGAFVSFGWHALMLQSLRPEHIFTLDGPFWSLALEVSLYIAMPLLVYLARVRGIGFMVAFAAVITLGYRMFCQELVGGSAVWRQIVPELNFVMIEFLPGQLVVFALGMWAAKLVSSGSIKAKQIVLNAIAIASCALGAWLAQEFTRYNPVSDSLFAVGFFAVILQASRMGTLAGAMMRWRPIIWLGQISYSVYLLHYPIMALIYIATGIQNGPDRYAIATGLAMLPVIIAMSYIFHIYCERPFMNAPRKTDNPLRYASVSGNGQANGTDLASTAQNGASAS